MSKSKKLLNESTIRRFGGLAGIKPATTSNFLGEMGMGAPAYDRDEEGDMEGEMGDMEPGAMDDAGEEPVEDMELDMEEPADDADEAEGLVMSLLDKVKEWASANGVDMNVQDDEGDMGDMGEMEAGEMDMELEESDVEVEEQTLEEIISAVLAEEAEEEIQESSCASHDRDDEQELEEAEETDEDVVEEAEENASQDEIIEEVVKRVRQRLVNLAKSEQ